MSVIIDIFVAIVSAIFQTVIAFFFGKMKYPGGRKKRREVSPLVKCARKIELATEKGDIERELAKLKTILDYRGSVENNNHQKYIWDQIEVIKECSKKEKSQQVQRLIEMIYLAYYEEEEYRLEDKRKIRMLLLLGAAEIMALSYNFYLSGTMSQSLGMDCLIALVPTLNLLPIGVGGIITKVQKKRAFLTAVIITYTYILMALLFLLFVCKISFTYMDMIVIGALLGLLIEIAISFFDFSKYENIQDAVKAKLEEIKED